MIIVVLISTIATAYWNFHIAGGRGSPDELDGYEPDSAVTAALDEISGYLRLTRPDSTSELVEIEHTGETDRIRIIHENIMYHYYVDNRSNLVRRIDADCIRLAEDVVSLKAFRMGSQTLIVTLSVRESDSAGSDEDYRSYSRVITSDALAGVYTRP